jgi:hypothetical protein
MRRLDCYTLSADPPQLAPGRARRPWMDAAPSRQPYRCLPMTIANSTGWELLCPVGFSAEWSGGGSLAALSVTHDDPARAFASSHFGSGTLTLHPGYLFRTDPGFGIVVRGAPNHIKHGIAALEGMIESDWLPFGFTMNWRFTAPGRARFEAGEPFCFVSVVELAAQAGVQPVIRPLHSDPDLYAQYTAWSEDRTEFNRRLAEGDPEAVKRAWQRNYFNGTPPEGGGTCPVSHVQKRRMNQPIDAAPETR